jgi:cell division topological specificity factor
MNFNTFISRFFGRDDAESSKNMAKERLRLVLVHDRLDISEQMMNALRVDLINVIGKYFGIEEKDLEVSLNRDASGIALVANIPLRRPMNATLAAAEDQTAPADAATANTAAGATQPATPPHKQKSPDQALPTGKTAAPPQKKPAAPKQSGAKQSGAKQGAAKQGAGKQNETKQNGSKQNGNKQNGSKQSGSKQNGNKQNGSKQNGSGL